MGSGLKRASLACALMQKPKKQKWKYVPMVVTCPQPLLAFYCSGVMLAIAAPLLAAHDNIIPPMHLHSIHDNVICIRP